MDLTLKAHLGLKMSYPFPEEIQKHIGECGGLNGNGSRRLIYLKTQSLIDGIV